MFITAARRGQNDWWRWGLMIGFLVLGTVVGSAPVVPVAHWVARANDTADQLTEYTQTMNPALLGMSPLLNLLLLVLPFAAIAAALLVGVRALHGRPARSLVSPADRVDGGRLAWAFGVWLGLALLLEGAAYAYAPHTYSTNAGAGWIGLLVVCLLLLPLQTSAEELFFRGYLWQGIGLLGAPRWVPLLVTTVLFSLPHLANPEAAAYGYLPALLLYAGAGTLLGLVTLLDDRLELALGVHAATNVFAAAFVSYQAAVIPTPALLVARELNIWVAVLIFYFAAGVFLGLAHRRYGLLARWREKLFGPLTTPQNYPPASDSPARRV